MLAFAHFELSLIIASFLANGIFMAMTEGMQKAFVVDLTTPETKGTSLGIHYALVGLSTFAGGIIIGGLWTYFNPVYAFLLPAGLVVLGLIAFVAIFGAKKGEIAPST